MSEQIVGLDVGGMYEFAYRRGRVPSFAKRFFAKAGDVSGLAGAINVTYGALVFDHINRETNGFAIIKKENWERSGFRLTTSNPATKLYGGADPGLVGAIIDTTPTELDSVPGFVHTPFDLTLDAGFRARHDDGLDIWDWKVAIMRDIHAQGINIEWLRSAEAEANTGGAVTDPKTEGAGVGVESLDRLISSDAEEDAVGGAGSGWYDVYEGQVDRDSATTYDSVVVRPDGSKATFGTNQPFQIKGLDQVINDTEDNGADPSAQVFLTGRDSRQALYDEWSSSGRFDLTTGQAKLSMAGLSTTATHAGRDITTQVRMYRDRALVVDKNVSANGTTAPTGGTGLEHWYLIDQRHIYHKVGFPTLYVDADNPVLRGQFDTKALYLTCYQSYMTRFNTSGKVRSQSA